MKIFGTQYRLTARGQKVKGFLKKTVEVTWAGAVGAGFAWMLVTHWFG